MRAVRVCGRHFNGRQPSGLQRIILIFDCGMSLLLGGGVGGGGGGEAYVRDKNTSARLCAKNAGGAYAQGRGGWEVVFVGHYGIGNPTTCLHTCRTDMTTTVTVITTRTSTCGATLLL